MGVMMSGLSPELMGEDKEEKAAKGDASALRIKTLQNIMIIYHKQNNNEKVREK